VDKEALGISNANRCLLDYSGIDSRYFTISDTSPLALHLPQELSKKIGMSDDRYTLA